nr:protein TIFY 5A-like [Ipomoea batatas]
MKRNCGLELRLVPSSLSFPAKDCHHFQQHPKLEMNKMMNGSTTKEEQQQLTIFYNGKVVSCDVTELQAKAIILVASQQKLNTAAMMTSFSVPSPLPSPALQSQQLCSAYGLSMKRSLKLFLQKRKNRVHAASPYQSYRH